MADSGNGNNGFASDDLRKSRVDPWAVLLSSTAERIVAHFWLGEPDPENITMATPQAFTKAHFQELQQLASSDPVIDHFIRLYQVLSAHKDSFNVPIETLVAWKDAVRTCLEMKDHKTSAVARLAGSTMLDAIGAEIGIGAVMAKESEVKEGATKSA